MTQPHVPEPPLLCHVVYRLDYGGLENGLVNLINHMPPGRFRHAIVSLTETTDFARRIQSPDVQIFNLHKRSGKDLACYWRLYRTLRRLRPDLVHTRNLGTLDGQALAWAAGVRCRVHSEHGWEVHDPEGKQRRYVRLRRLVDPLVHRYVALSREIESWLVGHIGIDDDKVYRITNGVDTERFAPCDSGHNDGDVITVGTVTRFTEIKDPLAIIDAFVGLQGRLPQGLLRRVRLLMVGDGPMRKEAERRVADTGLQDLVEFAGSQMDVKPWLHRMDLFTLGSLKEGISNTILEAMACGLPVVATRTGGNPELVVDGETGRLTEVGDRNALADAILELVNNPCMRKRAGQAARQRALSEFSIQRMVQRYVDVYDTVLGSNR